MRLTCRAVSWALKEKSMRTPLLAGLKNGPKRAAELAQQVNAPIVDVVRTLKALKGEGLIWRIESGEGAVLWSRRRPADLGPRPALKPQSRRSAASRGQRTWNDRQRGPGLQTAPRQSADVACGTPGRSWWIGGAQTSRAEFSMHAHAAEARMRLGAAPDDPASHEPDHD
jgi:hypothetical protein